MYASSTMPSNSTHIGNSWDPYLVDPQPVPVIKARRVHVPVGDEEGARRARAGAKMEALNKEFDGNDGVLLVGVDKGAVAQLAFIVPVTGAGLAVLVEAVGGLLICHHFDDLVGGIVRDLFAAFRLDLGEAEVGGL